MTPKILIMVLAADINGYDKLVDSIRNTWAKDKLNNIVGVLFYYGYRDKFPRPETGKVIKVIDNLICGYEEKIANIGYKTISAFEYVVRNYHFDYLLRCCAGSYYDQKELTKHLLNKPRRVFYNGIDGVVNGIHYVSGAGYILSRDVVELAIRNKNEWNHDLCDDMALGDLLKRKGVIACGDAKRYTIPDNMTFAESVNKEPIAGHYHYHFRKRPEMMYEIYGYIK